MSIGIIGKMARLRLRSKNPDLATGFYKHYEGCANRVKFLKEKQRLISKFGTSSKEMIKKILGGIANDNEQPSCS